MKKVFSIRFFGQTLCTVLGALFIFASVSVIPVKPAHAFACPLPAAHEQGRIDITNHIAQEFNQHRDWLTNTFFLEQILPALQLFTEQMSAVAMQQTMIIGKFFDAKHQLETQRLFQELQVQAHKDYQPSTTFCAFGTNVRSLGHSESVARYNAQVMGQRQLARHLGRRNMAGAPSALSDKIARWTQFTEVYCDERDNNWLGAGTGTGLSTVCLPKRDAATKAGTSLAVAKERVNIDIDYTRAVENRRILDISRPLDVGSPDEIDIQALGNNLYGHNILFRDISRTSLLDDSKPGLYLTLRSVAAKRAVAENSFNSIVALKSLGSVGGLLDPQNPATTNTYMFLGAVMTELGIPEEEIDQYMGLRDGYELDGGTQYIDFSYYSQLEILAKKIYQNPDFYANLYDKPANVKRIGTALKAIDLMLDRAIYESQLRQEMVMSVLLSSRLRMSFKDIDKNLNR